MILRNGTAADVDAMTAVQQAIFDAGKRATPGDAEFVRSRYILHPDQILLTVAEIDGAVQGFQVLKHAMPGNEYGVTPGWGIIGTHIAPRAARRGVGRALFERTLAEAKVQNFPAIDATIGASNADGLAYYGAMGFADYEISADKIRKRYVLDPTRLK